MSEFIKHLEWLVAEAKAGNINAIAYVTLGNETDVLSGWAGDVDKNVYVMLGGLSVLHREFSDDHVAGLKEAA